MTREGARGVEYNAWSNPPNSVDHEAKLVFTRMLSGPMDYTPGVLSPAGADGKLVLYIQGSGCTPPFVGLGTPNRSSHIYSWLPLAQQGRYAAWPSTSPASRTNRSRDKPGRRPDAPAPSTSIFRTMFGSPPSSRQCAMP